MIKIMTDRLAFDHLKRKYAEDINDSYYSEYDLPNEIWKVLMCDFTDSIQESKMYLVSNYGRIKNRNTNNILKSFLSQSGYRRIELNEPGFGPMKKQVHRLVGYAFIPNPDNLPQINHKRHGVEFRDFNYADNLEWVTNAQNIKHSFQSANKDVFSIVELHRIRELIQLDDWSTNSILNNLGRRKNRSTAEALTSIYSRRAHNDIFGDIQFGKRKTDKPLLDDMTIHEICKKIIDGYSNIQISEIMEVGKDLVKDIKVKHSYKKISDLYF